MPSRQPVFIPITIYKGADYSEPFVFLNPDRVTPINLTSARFRMQIRASRLESAALLATLDSDTGGIVIDPLTGKYTFVMDKDVTSAIDYTDGWYDLFVVDSLTNHLPFQYGPVKVLQNATRFS